MRPCIKCGDELILGENWGEALKRNKMYSCQPCINKKVTPEQRRVSNLWQRWKLRERDYQAILKSQGGGCALCGKTEEEEGRALAVDHVHDKEPLDIRGLLCWDCNSGIGKLKDNIQTLENAIHYLKCDYHKIKKVA